MPGWMVVTLISVAMVSMRIPSLNVLTAAFVAQYTAPPGYA